MAFDLAKSLENIAPTLASCLGGPLAGGAVAALEAAFGLQPGAGQDAITQVVQSGGMTPDKVAAVRAADQKHAEIISQQGIDIAKINADFQTAQMKIEADDRASARTSTAQREATWWIAVFILGTFALIMGAVLYGCWLILQGGITIKDVAVVAAISGLVGSIVGYVAANAQTVVNYIYGGSLGSQKNADALAHSVQQVAQSVASK